MFKALKKTVGILGTVGLFSFTAAAVQDQYEQFRLKRKGIESKRRKGFYEKNIKRPLDCMLATEAFICLSPLLLVTAINVKKSLGSPVLFTQTRPGMIDPSTGKERLFTLYKIRTMTDAKDENGALLSDELRLTKFGKMLRETSIDELPELINIIKGDMAVVGPRPQLVKDMVFMSDEYRRRHEVRPGLSGLAQIKGRNAISWEEKFGWDLQYIDSVCFLNDMFIVLSTICKIVGRKESDEELDLQDDFGDVLLRDGKISKEEYDKKQKLAKELLNTR